MKFIAVTNMVDCTKPTAGLVQPLPQAPWGVGGGGGGGRGGEGEGEGGEGAVGDAVLLSMTGPPRPLDLHQPQGAYVWSQSFTAVNFFSSAY